MLCVSLQTQRILSSTFRAFPARLQQHPTARVHGRRFTRRNGKKGGIELLQSCKKASPFADRLALFRHVLVVHVFPFPSIPLHHADSVHALHELIPQHVRCPRASKATRVPRDDHLFASHSASRFHLVPSC